MVQEAPAHEAPGLFRAEDLLELAREHGLEASRRLIVDWSGLGLLDKPQRRGLGRGKGSTSGWNETQAALFVDLLTLRQREHDPVQHVAGLANLPVLGWLYGEPGVPLRQVRRSLGTWCGRHRRKVGTSEEDAVRAASQFVKTVSHPHATVEDRARLRRLVIDNLRGAVFDVEVLRTAVRRVFDPHGEDRRAGPVDVPFHTDLFVRLAEARFTAISALDTFSDSDYLGAREIYIQSRAGYVQDQPRLATDAEYGRLFQPPDFERQLNSACVDLLTILGMSRLAPAGFGNDAQTAKEFRGAT